MKLLFRQPIVAVAIINASIALAAFVKDIGLAAFMGTSMYADALALAFFLPDSVGNNLLAAAIAVSCVPIFATLLAKQDYRKLMLVVRRLLLYFICLAIILLAAGYLFSASISLWLGGSGNPLLVETTLPLFRLLLPLILFVVVSAICSALLQAQHQFIIPAAAPLIFNLIFLAGIIYCMMAGMPLAEGIVAIAFSILIGTLIMALWIGWASLRSLRKLHIEEHKLASASLGEGKEMLKLFLPYLLILLSIQAIYLAERYLLTQMDTGAVAALNYAFRLTQVPIWIYVAAVSVVILPSLSNHLALGKVEAAQKVMGSAIRSVFFIVLPVMLFLFVLREPITIGLFKRGAFDEQSVALTTDILEGYTLSILFQAFSLVCLRYFLALQKLIALLIIFCLSAIVTVVTDVLLLQFMGVKGIGYGAAVGAALNAGLLLIWYGRHTRIRLSALRKQIRRHAASMLWPLVLLVLLAILWPLAAINSSVYSIGFVSLAGLLYIGIYLTLLARQWPEVITAVRQWFRKDGMP